MSAGPSPTRMRATTLFLAGDTRRIRAAWSSATQTAPAPIQMLYAAVAPSRMRFVTRAVRGLMR